MEIKFSNCMALALEVKGVCIMMLPKLQMAQQPIRAAQTLLIRDLGLLTTM